jgi:hypothetical protein
LSYKAPGALLMLSRARGFTMLGITEQIPCDGDGYFAQQAVLA